MKPAPFSYHAPKTIDEAVAKLAELSAHDGRILAGGQSLVPMMAFRMARPAHLIDINNVAGFDRLAVEGDTPVDRAVRSARGLSSSRSCPGRAARCCAKVVAHIAHYPIRLRGTFCGSLAHADPASEWCLTAVTLGADIVALSARGSRVIAADDYFEGMMMTTLAEDELLREVRLPLLARRCALRFLRVQPPRRRLRASRWRSRHIA